MRAISDPNPLISKKEISGAEFIEEELSDPVLGKWPEAKKKALEALESDHRAAWIDALGKCQGFRRRINVRLEQGDRVAQAFNREKIIPFGMHLLNVVSKSDKI